ncbi:hypothetical protein A2Z41_00070 [Microgenomates group bacterium RBG_19FT_COMBO_39_10]|nr:MAG: hypothetical protein A2Z41_00070 [Microgenomates group bacterium RBG_19FT_COMBO_39_10]
MAKTLKEKLIILLLILVPALFFVFSYFWVDYGLFLLVADGHPFFNHFQWMIGFRDSHRPLLANVYLLLIGVLFGLQIFLLFVKRLKFLSIKNLFLLAGMGTLFFSLAYPFLSRDLFTYLFSAKMVLFYRVNPFVVPPMNFLSTDLWVGMAHNIEFPYAYGPVSLLFSLIPMLLFSGQRFILNFLGYKLLNAALFYLTGFLLYKLSDKDKRIFSFWFFNPFLVVELLMNTHNDLLMIGLFIVALYYLYKGSRLKAWLAFVASVLIKYASIIALPVMFLGKKNKPLYFKLLSFVSVVLLLAQRLRNVQGWYYTWLYMFLPLAKLKNQSWVLISMIGMLFLSHYYAFVKWGFWGATPLIPYSKWFFYSFLSLIILLELNLPILKKRIKFFR